MTWRSEEFLSPSDRGSMEAENPQPRNSISSRRSSIASVFRRRSSVSSVASSIKSWWRPVSVDNHNSNVPTTPTHLPPSHTTITFRTDSFGPAPTEKRARQPYVPQHAASDFAKQTRNSSFSLATRAPSLSEGIRRASLAPPSDVQGMGEVRMIGGLRAHSFHGGTKAARAPSVGVVAEDLS